MTSDNTTRYIRCSEVYTPCRLLKNARIHFTDGIITRVEEGEEHSPQVYPSAQCIGDFQGLICSPGFIDEHIQGAGGFDFLEADVAHNRDILKTAGQGGCTEVIATITFSNADRDLSGLHRVVEALRNASHDNQEGAALAGIHLEGPYISPSRKGGFGIEYIREINMGEFRKVREIIGNLFRLVTLAPELIDADNLLDNARAHGVNVSVGHTSATYEQAAAFFERGANHMTHTFNAMAGLHHREPAAITAALINTNVFCEVIADGIHLHPGILRLLYHIKGAERLILITDSTAPCGLPEGEEFKGVGGVIKAMDGAVRLPDGTLAGSSLMMSKAVQNMHRLAGIPLGDVLQMATLTPARALGLELSGEIDEGKSANFVILDRNLDVRHVIRDGNIIYSSQQSRL